MGGLRRLRAGLPRLFADHREREAVAHRRLFAALESDLGPFSPLVRLEAWRTAALGVECTEATRALTDARRKVRDGKGRKPNARQVERLARRAGLANISYTQAVDRLRAMVANHAPTPDELLDRAHREMRAAAKEARHDD